ncbi:hypothetical protein [Sinanaerobacter sp. ZZT-01]|uniref:CDI toxin immunity protein n=1 Tax=Sinanaerobacter sp. ZZT-01 TaxID=3111540 RepID=UPI002D79D24F|nr:hypothetical protein [Sinanaerobacter sp. ZZT-01]WRR92365.1 hypothetical protein U5921_09850 [Sinanaerobacter sp. ZZT-01]
MNDELKKKLEKLKAINKAKNKNEEKKNNILLKECMEALHDDGFILDNEDARLVYHDFKGSVVFTPWGIDWEEGKKIKKIKHIQFESELTEICSKDNYYIIWGKGLPIIRCSLNAIINHLDDIKAVEVDTWLFSTDYSEIIEFYHEGRITLGRIGF